MIRPCGKRLVTRCILLVTVLMLGVVMEDMIAQENPTDPVTVSVLTFNILHGATMRQDFDLDVIARVINDAQPDLVALQEVDYLTGRTGRLDLVTELALRTSMTSLFARAMPYDGGEYGEGILSRTTFVATRNIPLPCLPGHEPRAAAVITTVLPSGDTIAFVGTHLAHEGEEDRLLQAKALVDATADIPWPVILAGDLNDVPGSPTMQIIEAAFTATYHRSAPEPTFPSHTPQKKIDYILYAPAHRWEVVETSVIADTIASDHCAYQAILRLLPPPPRD